MVWELLAISVRGWVITLCGMLLTGLAVFLVMGAPPLYYSHVRVVLLPPVAAQPNAYAATSASLIDLAGAVARSMEPLHDNSSALSGEVTLLGEGVSDGYAVRQRNSGGQWQDSFDDPILEVQAVGETPERASALMTTALDGVESALKRFQDDQGVAGENRVRTSLNPARPQLSEQTGSQSRAVGATVLIGIITTLGAVGLWGTRRGPRARLVGAPGRPPRIGVTVE